MGWWVWVWWGGGGATPSLGELSAGELALAHIDVIRGPIKSFVEAIRLKEGILSRAMITGITKDRPSHSLLPMGHSSLSKQ